MKQYIKDELRTLLKEHPHIVERYISFIEQCEKVEFGSCKSHKHHIIPRCLDKDKIYDKNNLVKLPIRHHIVAHLILAYSFIPVLCMGYVLVCSHDKLNLFEHNQRQTFLSFVRSRPVVNLNTGEIFNSGYTAATQYGHKPAAITTAIARKIKLHGFYWQYKDEVDKTSIEYQLSLYDKPIDYSHSVYNLNTGELFLNVSEASRKYNLKAHVMLKAISEYFTYGGYFWMHKRNVDELGGIENTLKFIETHRDEKEKAARVLVGMKNRKMLVETTTNKSFNSVAEAAKMMNVNTCSLSHALHHKNGNLKGYHFEFVTS